MIDLKNKQDIRQLGSGGFGDTTLCQNRDGHRFVVKTFSPKGSNDSPQALALFKAECDRLKDVGDHQQIPSYLGFEEQDGKYAIAQEYIPGESFRQVLNNTGPLTPEQALEYLEKLLGPLRYLHKHNIIHRDIKPDNIVLRTCDQLPCIVDFGAAKVVSETVLAKTGTMIGSASYAAPEQMAGQTSFQSDIYALGLTMLEMITGFSPFEMMDFSTGEWTWSAAISNFDPRLEQILKKMTQRTLRDRYLTVYQIQQDIWNLKRYTVDEAAKLQKDAE